MFQDHFGLHADPFALSPNLKYLYRSQSHAEIMAHLGYGLEQGEDIIMISGSIGTGKTLALQNLLAKVSKLFQQVLVNVTAVGYVEFLKLVLDGLGETWPPGSDAADLLIKMKRSALVAHADGRKILLVVDEAQNLDVETLEGIRLLTNLGQPDKQLFQIVLVGQPGLENLISAPELAQLRQRIRVHYAVEPLTKNETGEYIHHRTSVAGAMAPLFSPAAVARIHELSGGIPRLVNHLAGHAMLAAYVERARRIESHHVAADGLPESPAPVAGGPPPVEPAPVSTEPVTVTARPRATVREPRQEPRRRGLAWVWLPLVVVVAAATWYYMRDHATVRLPQSEAPAVAESSPPVDSVPESAAEAVPPTPEPAINTIMEVDHQPVEPVATHWIHVASFRDEIRLRLYRERLAEAGLETERRSVTLDDGEVWHRVLVGPYDDDGAAGRAAEDLEARGIVSFHRLVED